MTGRATRIQPTQAQISAQVLCWTLEKIKYVRSPGCHIDPICIGPFGGSRSRVIRYGSLCIFGGSKNFGEAKQNSTLRAGFKSFFIDIALKGLCPLNINFVRDRKNEL